MDIKENMGQLTDKIKSSGRKVNKKSSESFIREIINAKRVFLTGAGRSGLAAKAFAMRLMHLGLNVYVVGETTTPAIERGDALIAISGSGKTTTTLSVVNAAKSKGATVMCITYDRNAAIAKRSKTVIELEGVAPKNKYEDYFVRQVIGLKKEIAPMGTLFELTAMVFLDAVTIEIMKIMQKTEDSMKKRHSNLE